MTTMEPQVNNTLRVILVVLVAMILFLLMIVVLGCNGTDRPPAERALLETLRSDHLTLYDDAIAAEIRIPEEKEVNEYSWSVLLDPDSTDPIDPTAPTDPNNPPDPNRE